MDTTNDIDRARSAQLGSRLAAWPTAVLAFPLSFAAACAVDPAGDPGAELPHCVQAIGGEATCYATLTEAIAAATDGRITDAPESSKDALADGTLADRINAIWTERTSKLDANAAPEPGHGGNVVIGIVNLDAGFGGKDWVFIAPHGCVSFKEDRQPDWAVPNLNQRPYSNSDLNDNISSGRAFSNCVMTLYADWRYNFDHPGVGLVSIDTAPYVGDAMNDRASSISWGFTAPSVQVIP